MANKKDLTVQGKQEMTEQESTRPGRTYVPNVDIYETENAIWMWADMPGVDEKSIRVDLDGNVLTLEGQVATDQYGDLKPAYAEYHVGNYLRRFTIGNDLDPGRIGARMQNGVLEIELPKAEKARPRRIEVQVS